MPGRKCGVCASPWLDEINKYIYDKKFRTVTALHEHMVRKYGDQFDLSYWTVRRHVDHVTKELENDMNHSIERKKAVRKLIYDDIETITMVRQTLVTLANQLETVNVDLNDPQERAEVREIVKTVLRAGEVLMKYSDKITTKQDFSEEDMLKKMITCMRDFPSDLRGKFLERWKTYDIKQGQ